LNPLIDSLSSIVHSPIDNTVNSTYHPNRCQTFSKEIDMSVTITITDPTKDEALRVADYLYDLAGYGRKGADVTPLDGPVHTVWSESYDSAAAEHAPGVPVDTAQVFGSGSPDPIQVGATQELDSAGLPWDARIHASSRAKIADGTWRMKRGVDDATVAAVTAELKGAALVEKEIDAKVYIGDASGIYNLGEEVIPGVNADPDVIPPKGCHPDPVGQLFAPPPPPPPADTALTFPTLLQRVTAAKIAPETVLQAVQAQGLPSLPMLATRPDLLPAVAAALGV